MAEARTKRPPGRPKTLDRARTVQVATLSYWRDGVHGLSLNEVCRRAGVSKPALYREFGGEDGLMSAVIAHYRGIVVSPLLAALAAERPFSDMLHDLIEGLTRDTDAPAGCLLAEMRSSPRRLGSETAARVDAVAVETRQAYQAWFARAQSRGEANADVSPELAAHFLDTQSITVLRQMGLGIDPMLIRAQAELALRSLLPSAS